MNTSTLSTRETDSTFHDLCAKRLDSAFKHVLVCVDGSECSKKAVCEGIRIAKCEGAELTLLHVMTIPLAAYSVETKEPIELMEAESKRKGMLCLEDALAEAKRAGVSTKTRLVEGIDSPVERITSYAEENQVDLIVLGTRGLGGLASLLIGSVAREVVRHARCPVLVVR